MAESRRVILADPDPAVTEALARELRDRGHEVIQALDGGQALEATILDPPDAIVFDSRCPQISVHKFFQILRSNPATEGIPLVVTTDAPLSDIPHFHSFRDVVLIRPFNLNEISARLDVVLERQARARDLSGHEHRFEGDLRELGLPDLLQVLNANRRSGTIALTRTRSRGRLVLDAGELIHAQCDRVVGQKAFFRLLNWGSGRFVFIAERPEGQRTIDGSLEATLMEGMRQNDELRRLRESLPRLDEPLALNVPPDGLPLGLHPVTGEVLGLLDQPRTLEELLDESPATDYETTQAILALLGRSLLRRTGQTGKQQVPPLLAPVSLLALKGRIRVRYQGPLSRPAIKVFLLATQGEAVRTFLASLASHPGFQPDRRAAAADVDARGLLGTVGSLPLDEDTELVLWAAPAAAGFRPLWRPFLDGTAGLIFLVDPADEAGGSSLYGAYDYFYGELGLPAVVVRGAPEPPLEEHYPFLAELPVHDLAGAGCVAALGAVCEAAAAPPEDQEGTEDAG